MAAFKLGANDITAVYLGGQGICIVNDGADNVFDDGCGAQFTVTHTISDGISGSQYTVSTVPSSSKTGSTGDPYSFTTSVSPDTNYEFTSPPTISPSQPLTGTIGSADSTVTTTITGTVQPVYNPQNVTATFSLNDQIGGGLPAGYTISSPTPQTGLANPTFAYDFTSGFTITLTDGYEWVGGTVPTASSNISGTISSNSTISVTVSGGTVAKTQYSVTGRQTNSINGPSAGYNLTFDGSSITSTGNTDVTKQGTVTDADWSFVSTLTGPNAGYTASQALSLSSSSTTGAWGDSTTPTTSVATGTVALSTSSITLGGVPRACANYSCIIPGAGSQQSTTWYYAGSFGVGTALWSNSNLTGSQPSAGFWKNISGSGSVEYGAGSVSSTPSCVSSLNAATLRFNSTPASACSASANEAVFLDGAVISTASNVYTDSTGCSAGSNGYYSDGTYVRYASGGSFTTFASC